MKRNHLITIRASGEEAARLKKLAKHHALSVAGVVRMLVKKAADEIEKKEKR